MQRLQWNIFNQLTSAGLLKFFNAILKIQFEQDKAMHFKVIKFIK